VQPPDGPTRRICGRPVSALYPVQQRTVRVSCRNLRLQLHRVERLARTEEKGATRLAPKVFPFGDLVVFCVGRVHVAFKSGVVVVVVVLWNCGGLP
jgi:hypothetical protein